MWTLSVRPSRESGLAPVDVVVRAQAGATVLDLARALGAHLAPQQHDLLVVPRENGALWPADRPLTECGLRGGAILEVVTAPRSWVHQPGAPARRRALLRVISGPDAGTIVPVTGESATIGRSPGCTVSLADPLVSRAHARVLLNPNPVVLDEGSAHGTTVAGAPIRRATPVDWGTPITVGGSTVVLDPVEQHTAGHTSGTDADVHIGHRGVASGGRRRRSGPGTGTGTATGTGTGTGVLRSPRFGEPLLADTIEVNAPPTKQRAPMSPLAMMMMPLVLGVSMFATSRSIFSLMYVFAWPVAMFAGHYFQLRHHNKEFVAELAVWREDFAVVLARLDQHAGAQRDRAAADHPEFAELPPRVLTAHPMLWTRRVGDADFLAGRIGLGPVPALLAGTLRDGGEREVVARARADLAHRRILPDLPVCVPAGEIGLLSIAGPRDTVDAVARALLVRLCCDHSPADLAITAVLGRDAAHHETWLRWLPQVNPRVGGGAPVAVGAAAGQTLLDQLAAADNGTGQTVCLLDERAGVPRRVVEAVAAVAAERRLRLVWLGSDPDTVPSGTDLLLDLTSSVPAEMATAAAARPGEQPPTAVAQVARRDRAGVELVTSLDTLELATAWKLARAMTDHTDEAAVLPPDTAIPEAVRLADLAGDLADPDDEAPILERWAASRGLRAQIGMGVDGPVTLDLRDDGPHGLVAGTTGSGKSELLQSLICSLALNNPPSRMTFLLVDYKGGAAFRECADLPHTVGYITDLTPALVKRALTSLTAEVNAREETLARYGAKDLIALERDHPQAAPPSLLICVDEFAALTAEVPDFVDGMVNIAQRGRSLGLHMLLATQRPAGVVTAQIRANTDLRIALRVSATDDSVDVLDRPDAAMISRRTPGRAWIRRTGHGTAELVQAAWVGAREELRAAGQRVDIRPFAARDLAGDEGYDPVASAPVRLHARTDLDRLVGTIGGAFVRSGHRPPSKPWLPPLPGELLLGCGTPGEVLIGADPTDLADEERVPGTAGEIARVHAGGGQVPIGLADQPARQAQPPLVLDYPQAGSVLVYGASGSGKTELLRTVAVAATLAAPDDRPPYVYGIDFAGGGLGGIADWPAVGCVVGETQPERVLRLLRMVRKTVSDRNALLAAAGVSDLDALAGTGRVLPRIHLLVDNLPALVDTLEGGGQVYRQHGELLTAVLQEGRRVGVHLTATSPQRSGVPSAMQAAFGQRLVLRMTVDDDYMMLGAPMGVLSPDSPPGRGLLGRSEVQVATVGATGTALQVRRLRELGALVAGRFADAPPVTVPALPSHVPFVALPRAERDALVVGVEAEYVTAVTAALAGAPALVAGRARSGRTTALAGLAAMARQSTAPPAEIALLGAQAREAPQRWAYHSVLTDLADVVEWLPGFRTRAAEAARAAEAVRDAGAAEAGESGARGWSLLLVDDAHLWERDWDGGGLARQALEGLCELVDRATELNLAVVVATDTEEARGRQYADGLVQTIRRSRRGALLNPDYADGGLLGISIPLHTVEPLTGPGRGVWCADGNVQVVQMVSVPAGEGNRP